jgi:beta-aspartyl-peptidase (threonine type)
LSGATAESIGESLGEILVDPAYFFTEGRWREHRRGLGLPEEPLPYEDDHDHYMHPTGTVGAVALDQESCIAVLTSTGGRTNKLVGRIGDTPHMGAGFWAEEWKPKVSILRRVWNKLTKRKGKTYAIGVSGTGDGDVHGSSLGL